MSGIYEYDPATNAACRFCGGPKRRSPHTWQDKALYEPCFCIFRWRPS